MKPLKQVFKEIQLNTVPDSRVVAALNAIQERLDVLMFDSSQYDEYKEGQDNEDWS